MDFGLSNRGFHLFSQALWLKLPQKKVLTMTLAKFWRQKKVVEMEKSE